MSDSLTSLDQFFDPRLAGRVSILSETMDTMGLLLAWQGFDPSDFTDAQFEETLAVLQGHVDSGQIRQVTGNDYISGLDSGDLIAVLGWSGDVLALGEDYGFALPESGGLIWADSMIIPVRRAAQGERRTAHGLLLRPRDRGTARRLHPVRVPGGRRAGGDGGASTLRWLTTRGCSRQPRSSTAPT